MKKEFKNYRLCHLPNKRDTPKAESGCKYSIRQHR